MCFSYGLTAVTKVLVSIYVKTVDLCFSYELTAVTKVLVSIYVKTVDLCFSYELTAVTKVLVSIYVKTINLCFSFGLTAVTKILAKSVLGYCMMIFILLIYLVQKGITRFVYNDLDIWATFRSRSLQAFIMTVLFSLQKLVIGAFSLVNCVDILNKKVLYIEGDIKFYTWWQNIIQIYICVSVIPLLFIISHAPFNIKDKTMSVKMFILNCFFPLTAFLKFSANRLIQAKKISKQPLRKAFILLVVVHKAAVKFLRKNKNISGIDDEPSGDDCMVGLTQQARPKSYSVPPDNVEILVASSSRHTAKSTDNGSSLDESSDQTKMKSRVCVRAYNVCDPCLGDIHTGKCFQDNEAQTSSELEQSNERDISVKCTALEVKSAKNAVKHSKNEKVILDTLLKHYKCLQVRGIRFTWLGIHQAYRVILVVCNTYITEP